MFDTYTLVIVDMQPHFEASFCEDTIAAIQREILTAQLLRKGIVVLEYGGAGDTHPAILDMVKGYNRFAKRQKYGNSGYQQILTTCRKRRFAMSAFRICGVNLHACVYDTVRDLTYHLEAKVGLVLDGINDRHQHHRENKSRLFEDMAHVEFIRHQHAA